eukprot:TRINITY_DN58485_c0_g1_i1.p1 TRINITY_DN58485_c0_g1~~TRINITY_DN58485_c0_g1_i1.p1  ORF type:complete len:451 (+),score=143.46 TRINITY_DN58485_c0_g1_i1:98-1450(+)
MPKSSSGVKAMDLLKSALAERQAKAQKAIGETGQKWIRRGEVEAKRTEEYLEEQRQEAVRRQAAEEAQFQKFAQSVVTRKSKNEVLNKEFSEDGLALADALLDDDDAEPPLSLSEVIDRLRQMGFPITLFGETDMQRYKRLRHLEKEAHDGKTNPDVLMLEQVNESQRLAMQDQKENEAEAMEDEDEDEEKSEEEGGEEVPAAASDKSDSEDEAEQQDAADKSDSEDEGDAGELKAADDKSDSEDEGAALKNMPSERQMTAEGTAVQDKIPEAPEADVEVNTQLMDKCDFIRAWARKSLKAWEKELAEVPEGEKKTSKVKQMVAAHRQVRRDVRPLQRRLKMYVVEGWLLDKIHNIVAKADEREYRSAAEAYLDLSIGKAAWPVGIGCGGSMLMEDAIGLHDKFNRNAQVKDIAFALNDDVTRKFVQALKRLMNVAQRHWPPEDPSKASG